MNPPPDPSDGPLNECAEHRRVYPTDLLSETDLRVFRDIINLETTVPFSAKNRLVNVLLVLFTIAFLFDIPLLVELAAFASAVVGVAIGARFVMRRYFISEEALVSADNERAIRQRASLRARKALIEQMERFDSPLSVGILQLVLDEHERQQQERDRREPT
jgi:hypothetical protein